MTTLYRVIRDSSVQRAQSDPGACSYQELLTAVIGVPKAAAVAERILTRYPTPFDLGRAGASDLVAIPGVGPQTAAALRAACELARRSAAPHPSQPIRSAADADALLRPHLAHREQEYLYVLHLNTRNHLIGDPLQVYHGSLNTSLIRIGEVFRQAIKHNASGIIVAHNHPSGDVSPSADDLAVSRAMREAGALLDIALLDHLILGQADYISLRERGFFS